MCKTNEEFNISFDDHKEAIRRRIYDAWGTSRIVDSRMEKYQQWAHLGRKRFRDAARVSNPRSNKSSNDWRKIYERTLAHYLEERRTHLEAAAGKASSAISHLAGLVRSNNDCDIVPTEMPLIVSYTISGFSLTTNHL